MRSYLAILAAAAALTVFVTSFPSWMLDPYGIRHPLAGNVSWPVNDRASKIAFLAKNCGKFDAYFAGNSRTQILTGNEFAGRAGARYYNMGTLAEDIWQSLAHFEFLLRMGCPVSTLIVGESVDILVPHNPDSLWQREHPLVTGENPLLFYAKYFLGPQVAIAYLRSRADPSPHPMFYYPDGHVDYLWDMRRDADFALPICDRNSTLSAKAKEDLFGRLHAYRRLAALAIEYHVKVVVWLTPLSRSKNVVLNDADVDHYLAELRQISGLSVLEGDRESPLLSDFHQWHDCSHFHRAVFDQLIAPGISRLLQE
jgi:hypothetical protein